MVVSASTVLVPRGILYSEIRTQNAFFRRLNFPFIKVQAFLFNHQLLIAE